MSAHSYNFYFRILLVSILVALMGLSPIAHLAEENLVNVNQLIAEGDYLQASRSLARAALYFPWRTDLNLQAGRLAFQAGEPKAAIQYLERPGTRSNLSFDDMLMLGEAYNQAGDPYMAEAIWHHLAEVNGTSQVYQHLLDLHLQREDYPAVLEQLINLLRLNPSDIQRYYEIGALYAATDPLKALPYLVQAAQIDTHHAVQARSLHDKIRTANLFDDPAYIYLIAGRELANSGNWEMGAVAFQNAIDLKPDYADAWAFLGEARGQLAVEETGEVSTAGLYELDRALKADPDSVLANTFMGIYWERVGDYQKAETFLERAIDLNPEDPYLYSELGSILAKGSDLPEAQSAYETSIQLAQQEPLFYRLLAEFALQHQIQIRELALPAARQAIHLKPDEAASLDLMAQVMLELQDYHSAERFAEKALQVDSSFSPAYLHLGTAYLYLAKPDLARQWLSQAQEVDPDSWVGSQAQRMLDYYFP